MDGNHNHVTKPDAAQATIGLLFQHTFPVNWTHYTWSSQYRHTVVSRCRDIIEQCARKFFLLHNTIYCDRVIEACDEFIKRVKEEEEKAEEEKEEEEEEEEEEDAEAQGLDSTSWFVSDDYVSSLLNLLVARAQQSAPKDGLLDRLLTFAESEAPCSSFCIGSCYREGIRHCFRKTER
jgi:hypothetical protein